MDSDKPIYIDLQQVIDEKLGSKSRLVPRRLVRWLRRYICEDTLNDILRINHGKTGADFCEGALEYLDVKVEVVNPDKFPGIDRRRVIFVCNHPLGGLDGILLIDELCRRYGKDVRFVVNDLLMAVKPLQEVFLPINKHGRQDRKAIDDINKAMDGDAPVLVFPAGLVSRSARGGEIRDLQWHKMFVHKAVQYHRDVVPLFFSGRNSNCFYRTAKWRKRLGIKFNIEMLSLPREMVRARGSRFSIAVGDAIPWQSLRSGPEALAQAQDIKEMVYSLQDPRNGKVRLDTDSTSDEGSRTDSSVHSHPESNNNQQFTDN